MKNLGYVLFAAALISGCSDDKDAPPTTPTASGIFPISAFTGRDTRVEITGDATDWADGVTVDLGPDVTVNKVTVASPTDIFADITINDTAAIGLRDVTVNDSGSTFKLATAFELQSPVAVTTAGLVAQGGIGSFSIRQLDFSTPFDTTCGISIFGQCFQFVGVQVNAPAGMIAQVGNVTDFTVTGTLFIDVDAPAAGGALSVVSGASGPTITSTQGDAVAVTARTATTPTAGTASNETVNPGETGLFTISAGANSATSFAATTQAAPTMFLLGSSGHWADFISQNASDSGGNSLPQVDSVTQTASSFFVVYLDDGTGSSYSLLAKQATLAPVAEAEGAGKNDTVATAQVATKAGLVTGGVLEDDNDVDFFKITVVAGDVGKHVHVTTFGDPRTDTLVDVLAGATGATSLGESPDAGFQEDFQSDAIPSGTTTIFVKISASSFGLQPGHNTYGVGIFLE
jgi:hypothetical protein